MKVTVYDEMVPELIGIGQTSQQSGSLRKEASLSTGGRTKRREKEIAKSIRTKKNASKGKVESHTEEKSLKRTPQQIAVSRALKEGRKTNIKLPELENFVLADEPIEFSEEKDIPETVVNEVNRELSEKYGLSK